MPKIEDLERLGSVALLIGNKKLPEELSKNDYDAFKSVFTNEYMENSKPTEDNDLPSIDEIDNLLSNDEDNIIKDNDTIKSDIEEALDTIFEKLGKRSDEVIYDFVEEKSKKVMISNIVYIESSLHRISFHVYEDGRDKIYTIYKKMDDIEIEFKAEELVRVHQSFIVNMKYVCDIKRYCVKLINSIEIPVSKQRYKNAILEYARQKGEI